MSALLEVREMSSGYGRHPVVHNISMHVNRGTLACLLGPSGCGKTTILRAVAGFEPVLKGEISLVDRVVSQPGLTVPPEKRRIGMVFQDNALFPHLTVSGNVAFGVRHRRTSERRAVVGEMLEIVGLSDLADRYPHELSGGQQQRVALARALTPHPQMVLLDEPFSSLDVELKERLGREVRDILKARSITAVLVTHDQSEAFALSDQIGVMCDGRILQWDTAYNLYHEPADRFIADFIGQGVFVEGVLLAPDSVETELGVITGNRAYGWGKGRRVEVLLRPDDIQPDAQGGIFARVATKAFKGPEILYSLKLPTGTTLLSLFPSHLDYGVGEEVRVRIAADHLVAFPV
ncbi:MAG: ABC transporter ATP-binding protein [Gammaproteobacteria bacterium]|nr:ABC transporter ATP-binding protein [Gammaproteobacteria bacterium]NIR82854.1 ABC transporter ATP-binding protein [Gammaproteobacteria bacterium]NIR89963.1 ABC transporter ATP-binding protein [Gammaproteobacteria bacterium]NIU04012.1 ABC transporter ATP-binding protein [Gammaproteobacteria bacterium]NIV51332.1 ATP-binding cassette domain-containing protein [Gammaproteobacteria bacterium]